MSTTNSVAGDSVGGQWAAWRLAAMFAAGGTMHFVAPRFFDSIIPPVLPGSPRTYTVASGVAALSIAGSLAAPRSRRNGAALAALFFVAVMPAKVQTTINLWRGGSASTFTKVVAIAQLLGQIPLLTEAAKVRRSAPAGR